MQCKQCAKVVHYSLYCPLQPVCKQTKSHSEPTLRRTLLVELAIIQPRTFSPEDFPNRSKSEALKKRRKLITLQIHYIWAQNILLGDFKFFSRHLVMVNPIPCSTTSCPPCFISKTMTINRQGTFFPVSVMLFGSCLLILFVSSTEYFPIVGRQRCLSSNV